MKATLELQIINENPSLKLLSPTIEDRGDRFFIEWKYQKTSYACQGEWAKIEESILKSEYDFNEVVYRLTDFIKWEYKL